MTRTKRTSTVQQPTQANHHSHSQSPSPPPLDFAKSNNHQRKFNPQEKLLRAQSRALSKLARCGLPIDLSVLSKQEKRAWESLSTAEQKDMFLREEGMDITLEEPVAEPEDSSAVGLEAVLGGRNYRRWLTAKAGMGNVVLTSEEQSKVLELVENSKGGDQDAQIFWDVWIRIGAAGSKPILPDSPSTNFLTHSSQLHTILGGEASSSDTLVGNATGLEQSQPHPTSDQLDNQICLLPCFAFDCPSFHPSPFYLTFYSHTTPFPLPSLHNFWTPLSSSASLCEKDLLCDDLRCTKGHSWSIGCIGTTFCVDLEPRLEQEEMEFKGIPKTKRGGKKLKLRMEKSDEMIVEDETEPMEMMVYMEEVEEEEEEMDEEVEGRRYYG